MLLTIVAVGDDVGTERSILTLRDVGRLVGLPIGRLTGLREEIPIGASVISSIGFRGIVDTALGRVEIFAEALVGSNAGSAVGAMVGELASSAGTNLLCMFSYFEDLSRPEVGSAPRQKVPIQHVSSNRSIGDCILNTVDW